MATPRRRREVQRPALRGDYWRSRQWTSAAPTASPTPSGIRRKYHAASTEDPRINPGDDQGGGHPERRNDLHGPIMTPAAPERVINTEEPKGQPARCGNLEVEVSARRSRLRYMRAAREVAR